VWFFTAAAATTTTSSSTSSPSSISSTVSATIITIAFYNSYKESTYLIDALEFDFDLNLTFSSDSCRAVDRNINGRNTLNSIEQLHHHHHHHQIDTRDF
jgi:hypothetical protein